MQFLGLEWVSVLFLSWDIHGWTYRVKMGPPRMNIIQIWVYLLVVLVDCNERVPNTVSPRLAGPGRAPHGATSPEVCVVWVGSATGSLRIGELKANGIKKTKGMDAKERNFYLKKLKGNSYTLYNLWTNSNKC